MDLLKFLKIRQPCFRSTLAIMICLIFTACGGGNSTPVNGSNKTATEEKQTSNEDNDQESPRQSNDDMPADEVIVLTESEQRRLDCQNAEDQSLLFVTCEQENYARATTAPIEQLTDLAFQGRLLMQSATNTVDFFNREANDPFWDSSGNLCATHADRCVGDPFRYESSDIVNGELRAGQRFYTDIGEVIPVNFYDNEGARLSGRVWAPLNRHANQKFPAIVILNGSVQAPETLYWWGAQLLVNYGYVVMTFDVRAQGRSDTFTPDGQTGSNANSVVFRRNLIDAVDFFYSTPDNPYAHNLVGTPGFMSDNGEAQTTSHNPFFNIIDRDRFGVIGHSLGATGVSVVQGEQPWPGHQLTDNPIDAVVAWDTLALSTSLDGVSVLPRVPAMGQAGDYFLTPTPLASKPDPEAQLRGFKLWKDAGIASMQVNISGATHYEWSLLPSFPASSWEGGLIIAPDSAADAGGWAQPMAQYYTLAWMDRWLKIDGEIGFNDADQRLLNHRPWWERFSFYYKSAMSFTDRSGVLHQCDDLGQPCR